LLLADWSCKVFKRNELDFTPSQPQFVRSQFLAKERMRDDKTR
jgi:hypothetical protein